MKKPPKPTKEQARVQRCAWLLSIVTHPTFKHEKAVPAFRTGLKKKTARQRMCVDLATLHATAKEIRGNLLKYAASAKNTMGKLSRLLRAMRKP